MSALGGKAENICSHGAFPVLTESGPQPPTPVCILAVRSPGRAAWRPFWFLGMYSQRRRCRLVGDKLKFSAQSVHYLLLPLDGQSRPCTRPRPKAIASHDGTASA